MSPPPYNCEDGKKQTLIQKTNESFKSTDVVNDVLFDLLVPIETVCINCVLLEKWLRLRTRSKSSTAGVGARFTGIKESQAPADRQVTLTRSRTFGLL